MPQKRKHWVWIYLVTIIIAVFGLVTRNLKLVFLAVVFLFVSGLIVQLRSGRILDRSYNTSVSKNQQPRLYWDIIVGTVILIILAVCGYILLFVTHTLK